MSNKIFWCKECNVPLLQKTCENCGNEGIKICSDLKPMFKQESDFLEEENNIKLPGKSWEEGLWMRYKTIWFEGKRLLRLSAKGSPTVIKKYRSKDSSIPLEYRTTPELLYKANKTTLDKLEKDAFVFIQETVEMNLNRKPIVSFSGGKDSTVVSHLVRKALKTENISHIFGDTTIEYPDTLEYIKRFFGNNKDIPFKQNSSNHTFIKMCELIGPPSRINAWCCSVFKASPIAIIVNKINGKEGVVSFEGIRRGESVRRRNRRRIYHNKKIVHQLSAYPILNWKEIEVWLYILSKNLDFNDAYRKGFNRVGCMYCPNNVPYNEYLIKTYYPEEAQRWENFLLGYAKKIGKLDASEYISSGAWKMRVGKGKGQSSGYVKKVPCLKNENAMHFILDKKITKNFVDRFKPFGKIEKFSDSKGEGFVVKDSSTLEGLFVIKEINDIAKLKQESKIDPLWELGESFLCVDLLTTKKKYLLLQRIERQIRKFQACVLCNACAAICPTSAIRINPHFRIDEDKCLHCGRCIRTKLLRDSCVSLHANQQTKRYRL